MEGMKTTVSIMVATHNRPELLREALTSIANQSSDNWEAIIVDDGSHPPVGEASIREIIGDRFLLVRHDKAKGIAGAKNAGVERARGDILVHLDDDDLLAGNAVELITRAFDEFPELECLFANATAFGKAADYGIESQRKALDKVLAIAGGDTLDNIIFFDDGLFFALLESIPWAFQRPVARKSVWDRIGLLPSDVDMPEPEWSLKASLMSKTALLLPEIYRVRMDGQSYVSQPSRRSAQIESVIASRTRLLDSLRADPGFEKFRSYAPRAQASLAMAYFRKAYYYLQQHDDKTARSSAMRSFQIHPTWGSLKLWARSWL